MTDNNGSNPPINEVPPEETPHTTPDMPHDDINERVDRLRGEPAPDISPEEFARLSRAGSINLDAQGRVRANRREESDPGVSLRKRRAWYA